MNTTKPQYDVALPNALEEPAEAGRDSPWFGRHRQMSAIKAGAWATVANAGSALLSLVGTVILSRLLHPNDVGLFTLAFTFYSIPSLIVGPSLTAAAVQAPHLSRQQSSNLFWINVGANSLMAAVLSVSAPFLASLYDQPLLVTLCPIFAAVLILEGMATQYRALLTRSMRFDIAAKIQLFVGSSALVLAVVLANRGFGVWALVTQVLVAAVIDRIVTAWAVGWTPGLFSRRTPIRELLHFSAASGFALLMHLAYAQSQALFMGRFATISEVGLYSRGQALFQKPFAQITGPLFGVLLPILSARQQEPNSLGAALYRANSVTYTFLSPLLAWMAVSGPDIAVSLLGAEWTRAGSTLRFFALAAFPVVIYGALHKTNEAVGRPLWSIGIRALFLPALLCAIAAVAHRGAVWIAAVTAAVELCTAPLFLLMLFRQSPVPHHYYLPSMASCTIVFLATTASAAIADRAIAPYLTHPAASATNAFVCAYAIGLMYAYVFPYGRDGIREVLALIRRLRIPNILSTRPFSRRPSGGS